MARAIIDLTKRIQQLETAHRMRGAMPYTPRPVLMRDNEHPGASLGIGTHRTLGEPLDEEQTTPQPPPYGGM